MNQKSEPVTTSDEFRRRFPTKQALIAYLLITPPDREVTAQQLYDEQTKIAKDSIHTIHPD
jgi:hypothetical protein